ncbi:hypothetical protein [Campylobacter helveticus]|uniref:hypothetical protein n=1 Tax=Campylobacter helveticus TaxID=28898 RepID=UPI0022EADBA6|nr:hypothetical protein [Campylobacter helveticus]
MNFKEFLIEQYKLQFPNPQKQDCLRIFYIFNGVKVHLYFDAFEEECNLLMILTYNKDIYVTGLSIYTIEKTLYLHKLKEASTEILYKILKNNKILEFHNAMKKHIEECKFEQYSYKNNIFQRALKNRKNVDGSYVSFLKRVRMSDQHLEFLNKCVSIDRKILELMQRNNLTIVTTNNPLDKKQLSALLLEENIRI